MGARSRSLRWQRTAFRTKWCPVSAAAHHTPYLPKQRVHTMTAHHPITQLHRFHHQILRSPHLFEPLSEAQPAPLPPTPRLLKFHKGDDLFLQGEPAPDFYFVING